MNNRVYLVKKGYCYICVELDVISEGDVYPLRLHPVAVLLDVESDVIHRVQGHVAHHVHRKPGRYHI